MNKNNNIWDKKLEARKLRGQINQEDLNQFKSLKFNNLIIMLSNKDSQKRTIAGTLLSNDLLNDLLNDIDKEYVITSLANSFKEEKALYSRIAISESLASYGELAVPYLINLLGEIGNNQEKELPKKYFNKKSFPLPRDLASRTLANIGDIATPYLIDVLNDNGNCITNFKKEQALDSIGAIAYKYNDHRAYTSINDLFIKTTSSEDIGEEYKKIIVWKITRSLSGFKNNKNALNLVIDILNKFNNVNEIQWEAIRSIGQIGIVNNDVKIILNDFDNIVSNSVNNINCSLDSQIKLALKVSKDSLGIF